MPGRALVVDANILVRAVLGKRVRELIEANAGDASFFVPEVAYAEVEEHLAALVIKRGGDPEKALVLRSLGQLMELIGSEVYSEFETEARERLGQRDPEDWPRAGHGTRPLGARSGLKTPASSPLPLLRLLPGGANQFPGGTCTRRRPSPIHGAGGPGEVHRGAKTTSLAPAAQREAQRRKARRVRLASGIRSGAVRSLSAVGIAAVANGGDGDRVVFEIEEHAVVATAETEAGERRLSGPAPAL
jgi:hypothetical protein